ncbi:hypothetical protein PoB_006421700 [Plakobranchus ocellatus]|uniref:Uncharacterized protein n=1 Tax=Plakobranchus ocellatus TaxID=259542 RepID=A0AAV4D0J9_9GAST|nr:hypothetical protein PoB_006421700 [Plakobranchus ocellatus]
MLFVPDRGTTFPRWLEDSDNTTCNSEPNSTLLHLGMHFALHDFWIRLETKDINIREITEESMLQFGTGSKTEALQSCDRLEVSEIVAGRSFNIYCTLGNMITDIYIRGRVVAQLCSLYVSAGRAVPFILSSEAPTRSVEIRRKSYLQGANHTFNCTSVQNTSDREARATVNFAYPVSLDFLAIHAPRKDAQKSGSPSATSPAAELKPMQKGRYRTQGRFAIHRTINASYICRTIPNVGLKSAGTAGTDRRLFISNISNARYAAIGWYYPFQSLDLTPRGLITDFEIANVVPSEDLTVCEIHLLGEINCPIGTFSLSCNRQCNCNSSEERCHVATGYCSSGCTLGYKGEDCWTSKLEVGFLLSLD